MRTVLFGPINGFTTYQFFATRLLPRGLSGFLGLLDCLMVAREDRLLRFWRSRPMIIVVG